MYRGKDSRGDIQGGPMYIIRQGLGPRWHWLATVFAAAALIGTLPIVQVNQLTQVMCDVVFVPAGLANADEPFLFNFLFGLFAAALVASVIFGGVKRLGYVTPRLAPFPMKLASEPRSWRTVRPKPKNPCAKVWLPCWGR
jgi:AGCS family alanine or glycine:cation symporter